MKILLSVFLFALVILLGNCREAPKTTADTVQVSEIDHLQKGKQIATATFATLSTKLQKAMKEGGVQNAVEYCNLAASPLVDSLSKVYDAKIRRTALRVRNVENKPTAKELAQLKAYQAAHDAGEKLEPVTQEVSPGTVAFYAPIPLMPLCEKCHGTVGEQLAEGDHNLIKQLYPDDQAINFKSGDLRGMWSIQFRK